ncbi:MAG: hypothetical protein ABL934_08005 [Lysobacteraceae bacterium]
MSGKVSGLVLFAVGLAAVFAGYYLVAFAVIGIGIGVLLVATGSGSARRPAHSGAVAGDSAGFDTGTSYYGDSGVSSNDARDSSDQCHASDDGGGYSDSGGDCGGSDAGGGDGGGGGD